MFEFFAKLGSIMQDAYEAPPDKDNKDGYLKRVGSPLNDEWAFVDTRKRERTVVSVYIKNDRKGKPVYHICAGNKAVPGSIRTEVVWTQFELDRLVDELSVYYKPLGRIVLENGI